MAKGLEATIRALVFLGLALAVWRATRAEGDYVGDVSPSAAARACFAAVPPDLKPQTVSRRSAAEWDEDGVYFTDDGAISIPPGAMVMFRNAGKCMDPHLPAPCSGEPMQFIGRDRLIPRQLRQTYDTLMKRSGEGDTAVKANNLQHLVWAIRTAGTDDPMANNLSEAQRDILDECSGRRGGFTRYHEREKKLNAKRGGRGRAVRGRSSVSVGRLSYDASELLGTNAVRRIQEHIDVLTEMGESSKTASSADFRYGEIEEELYSDIVCEGGLSFSARILNVSDHRKEFKASEFAAQVGNGAVSGTMRQRVTMTDPDVVVVVMGAVGEEVEADRDGTIINGDVESNSRGLARTVRRSRAKSGSVHSENSRESERVKRESKSSQKAIEEVAPVPPVPPVPPVTPVAPGTVTNEVVRAVPEQVAVHVVSLSYDVEARTGVLTVEIVSGSFRAATAYIRSHFGNLVRRQSDPAESARIPKGARLEMESISVNEKLLCEVAFRAAL